MTGPVIHPDLNGIPLGTTEQPAYDRPFELQLLHHDQRMSWRGCRRFERRAAVRHYSANLPKK